MNYLNEKGRRKTGKESAQRDNPLDGSGGEDASTDESGISGVYSDASWRQDSSSVPVKAEFLFSIDTSSLSLASIAPKRTGLLFWIGLTVKGT